LSNLPPDRMIRTDLLFPLQVPPLKSFHEEARFFGATRHDSHRNVRLHAAVDLLGTIGTKVYAMADGITGEFAPSFYTKKDQAVAILHGNMTVRYCEIKVHPKFQYAGVMVKAGEEIGAISVLAESNSSMLHLEMYDTITPYHLTVYPPAGGQFRRAGTLVNPTSMVEQAARNSCISLPPPAAKQRK